MNSSNSSNQNTNSISLSEVNQSVETGKKSKFRKLLAYFGPAYLVSVGYMDPGNWATDIAAGSSLGYKLIWVLLLSNLTALLLQSLSARLGLVSGMDLAQASRSLYNPFINKCLFLLAQIAIIAMDLAEVLGVAIGLNLLFGLPLAWGVTITVLDSFLLLLMLNKGIRIMEAFIISMLFIVGISFIAQMFIVKPEIVDVMAGFKPEFLSGSALYLAIGIIGATVMPHNLYLHSSLVQTRKVLKNKTNLWEAIKYNFIDTFIALNLAFFVNAAILITAAAAFFTNGLTDVAEIHDAHKLLGDIFGSAAPILFAIALIASGQSSTITGTLAGQIVMEGHMNLRIAPWVRRLFTRVCAVVPALFTIFFLGDQELGKLLIFSQVILSLQLGFAIVPLVFLTSDKKRMGEFSIKIVTKILAWLAVVVIVGLNIQLVIEELSSWYREFGMTWWLAGIAIPIVIAAGLIFIYILIEPLLNKTQSKLHSVVLDDSNKNVQLMHDVNPSFHMREVHVKKYEHIAITLDFSSNDQMAIAHALMLGGKESRYLVMHVAEGAAAQYGMGKKVDNFESNFDQQKLAEYCKEIKNMGYQVDKVMGYGRSVNALKKMINDASPKLDLVVLSAHKHKGIQHYLYGSTISKLRRQIKDIPILVV